MSGQGVAGEFLDRIDRVEQRLASHAAAPPPAGLTEPDPPTGERWDAGQVWAHLGEFVPYWVGQIRAALATPASEVPPFGRVKSDPGRVAAIEADRHRPPQELMELLRGQLPDLRVLIREMSPADWTRTCAHSTLGEMDMPRIVDEFLVGHLEQHAAQLDGLTGARQPTA